MSLSHLLQKPSLGTIFYGARRFGWQGRCSSSEETVLSLVTGSSERENPETGLRVRKWERQDRGRRRRGRGEEAMSSLGIWIDHLKICRFSTRIILSWRHSRNSRCHQSSLPSPTFPHLPKSRLRLWITRDDSRLLLAQRWHQEST